MKTEIKSNTTNKFIVLWVVTLMIAISLAFLYGGALHQQRTQIAEQERALRGFISNSYHESYNFSHQANYKTHRNKMDLIDMKYNFKSKYSEAYRLELLELAYLYYFCYNLIGYKYDVDDTTQRDEIIFALAEVNKDISAMAEMYLGKRWEEITWQENFNLVRKVQGKDKEFNKKRDEFYRGLYDRYYIDLREQMGNR